MKVLDRAVSAIECRGVLLVFPVQNRPGPRSLWHELHPRSEMRWAWDEGADARVVALWHLREELAQSRRVVYTKWLGGRATFFSKRVFVALLASLRHEFDLRSGLDAEARSLLELLLESSPQGPRALRAGADLQGPQLEATYTRATKALWARLLIVGAGETDEGGYPSLAMAATELLFEDLWMEAETKTAAHEATLAECLGASKAVARTYGRTRRALAAPVPDRP